MDRIARVLSPGGRCFIGDCWETDTLMAARSGTMESGATVPDAIGDAGYSAPVRPTLTPYMVAGYIERVGNCRCECCGPSARGWLALDFAIRCPELVNSMGLITPAGIADKNVILWALPLLLLGSWGARKVQERIIGSPPTTRTEFDLQQLQERA